MKHVCVFLVATALLPELVGLHAADAPPPFNWERCYFCYTWGYSEEHPAFDWYPDFDKPLGPPLGEAKRTD